MKIRIQRETNDDLINNGIKSKDDFICDPENFSHEMVGWEFQHSKYVMSKDELIIVLSDKSTSQTYLDEQQAECAKEILNNQLYDLDANKMIAKFTNDKRGNCFLEFIDNDGVIEPYMVIFVEHDETCYIELLDTDIVFINLYAILQELILKHK